MDSLEKRVAICPLPINAPASLGYAMVEAQLSAIQATLNEYPLCQQIVLFLVENQNAMDTVRGIATCWIGCDEAAALAALERLILCGAVIAHRLRSGTLYALTPDHAVRDSLRTAVDDLRKWLEPTSTQLDTEPVSETA